MTGFGRGESVHDNIRYTVELSSVNRKQLDVVTLLPRELASLEINIHKMINPAFSRGRIQVSLNIHTPPQNSQCLDVNIQLARKYAEGLIRIGEEFGLQAGINASFFLQAPGVFHVSEIRLDTNKMWPHIELAVKHALVSIDKMRKKEGEYLKTDLLQRLSIMNQEMNGILKLSAHVITHYRKMLLQRLCDSGLNLPLEDERILREIGIFAERSDISEEITRVFSHLDQFHLYLDSSDPQGRSLDFLSQEIHRELNTIGSKANSAEISHHVVRAKTELEKIREQVQNVE